MSSIPPYNPNIGYTNPDDWFDIKANQAQQQSEIDGFFNEMENIANDNDQQRFSSNEIEELLIDKPQTSIENAELPAKRSKQQTEYGKEFYDKAFNKTHSETSVNAVIEEINELNITHLINIKAEICTARQKKPSTIDIENALMATANYNNNAPPESRHLDAKVRLVKTNLKIRGQIEKFLTNIQTKPQKNTLKSFLSLTAQINRSNFVLYILLKTLDQNYQAPKGLGPYLPPKHQKSQMIDFLTKHGIPIDDELFSSLRTTKELPLKSTSTTTTTTTTTTSTRIASPPQILNSPIGSETNSDYSILFESCYKAGVDPLAVLAEAEELAEEEPAHKRQRENELAI